MLVDARAHASATERQRLSEALLSKLTRVSNKCSNASLLVA